MIGENPFSELLSTPGSKSTDFEKGKLALRRSKRSSLSLSFFSEFLFLLVTHTFLSIQTNKAEAVEPDAEDGLERNFHYAGCRRQWGFGLG